MPPAVLSIMSVISVIKIIHPLLWVLGEKVIFGARQPAKDVVACVGHRHVCPQLFESAESASKFPFDYSRISRHLSTAMGKPRV